MKRARTGDDTQVPSNKLQTPRSYLWTTEDGAEVEHLSGFLTTLDADELFQELLHLEWQEEILTIMGRQISCPRKTLFFGERAGLTYRYSGKTKVSVAWSPLIEELRSALVAHCGQEFNVVLLNYYKDGQDYIGFHSDDEKDMPRGSKIASVSLGMARRFVLKAKKGEGKNEMVLRHGDLLVMGGTTQQNWKHSLPKLSKRVPSSVRINLTFRLVRPECFR